MTTIAQPVSARAKTITVALAGNPNSGKTTVFNRLTGARQQVGNYPGVTVERKEGVRRYGAWEIRFVDLPGTYSLTAYSTEEVVARDFVLTAKPDVVVDVVDASNLERNLYLATQLMELRAPLVLALNMSDVARARGYEVDIPRLSALLGVPIVPTAAHRGEGMDKLLEAIVGVASGELSCDPAPLSYGVEIDDQIDAVEAKLRETEATPAGRDPRWTALKLIENDELVRQKVHAGEALEAADHAIRRLQRVLGDSSEIIIADRRYGFISGACQEAVRSTVETRHLLSDKVDAVLAHRILGLPIFLALMYLVFQLTFTLGGPPMEWIEAGFSWAGSQIAMMWPKAADSALRSLLVDGIIGGVGGVIVFLPNIMLLFLAIALLEDSGYMARAAFVMDHIMHRFRLHGKSFIPMLIGFGCSVPAIMATRTLETERDRLTTMLVAPLMSCGARLPIYALIIPAFFPRAWQAPMLWLIYMIGIVLALVLARLLRSSLLKGESTPFVMELPPYRMPTVQGTVLHMWGRSWMYLKKAGTIILAISILLWVLTTYPKKQAFDVDYAALEASATEQYLSEMRELGASIGLSEASPLLVGMAEADAAFAEAEATYYPHEPGYAEAEAARDAAMAALLAEPQSDRLAAFLDARDAVRAARDAFARAVEEQGLDEGSSGYAAMELVSRTSLDEIRRRDPEAYAAVVRYLDEVQAAYEATRHELVQQAASEAIQYSVAGRIGRAMEPVLRPMGFDWRVGTALVGAVAAKEVFVAQLGIVYAVGEADEGSDALRAKLREAYTPLVAFCIMLFTLISAPCMATFAITRSESNSWGWASLQWCGLTGLAWVITVMVYQVGQLVGLGA